MLLVAVGMRYKSYCANLGRSFIVDPSKVSPAIKSQCLFLTSAALQQEQEAIYSLLVSLQSEMLSRLKDGAVAKDLYQHALSFIKERKPELESHFSKNIGHGVSVCSVRD